MGQVEVAVIGAGAAGLAAAVLLRSAGVDALLLEARGRIGGRAHTDLSVPNAPFDCGASYIHAADQGNPWLDLALGEREPLLRDQRRRAVFDAGKQVPMEPYEAAVAEAWRLLGAAVARTTAEAAGAVLPSATAADHFARALVGPWLSGAACDEIDTADFLAARDGDDWLVPAGYGRLVARFGARLPVRLSCPVTALRSLAGSVEVATAQGTLRADHVILTVPLGVLAVERISFDPPLAAAVLGAIEALPMGNLVKLRVRLRGDPIGVGDNVYVVAPPQDERAILWLARPFGRDS